MSMRIGFDMERRGGRYGCSVDKQATALFGPVTPRRPR
jgi:hypothetical protein